MKTSRVTSRRAQRGTFALALVYRDPRELKPHASNPRLHSEKQIAQIARSMQHFGFLIPILLDSANSVIAGHGRLLAALKLGLTEVPTVSVDHLTEAQKTAYRIADNQISLNATWDQRLLGEQLVILSDADLNFDLTVIGMDIAEIDMAIENLTDGAGAPSQDDDPLPLEAAVSKIGDLWQLGSHRVLCGNALEPSSYDRLMEGKRGAVTFADPPFNVKVSSISGLGQRKHREFAMASGEMSRRQFTDFLRSAFERIAENSRDGSLHMIVIDWRHVSDLIDAGESVFGELKNLCVWVKDAGGMGSLWRSRHELICVFKLGTAAHINNVELGRFGRNRTNVWEFPSPKSFAGRGDDEADLLREHPTPKPVSMIADALMDVSARGDIVLDPFLGSGSTLIAAERVGRVARGIDLDPRYVDLTIRRWERLAKRSAVHAYLQLTFAEVKALREEGGHD